MTYFKYAMQRIKLITTEVECPDCHRPGRQSITRQSNASPMKCPHCETIFTLQQ